MSFNFEVTVRDGLVLDENSDLMQLIELYTDFKNYTANKIGWDEVRQSLQAKREYLRKQGVLVNAIDDRLETPINFEE